MKIAVDIDEVLFEYVEAYLDFLKERVPHNKKYEDFVTYNFWELFNISREEAIKIADEFYDSPFFDKARVVDGSKESLEYLTKKGFEIYFLTSRPIRWKKKTTNFLKKNYPFKKKNLIFSGDFHKKNGETKAQICKKLGISLIVEDNLFYALDCASKGIYVLLFDRPWNKQKIKNNKIKRCFNWKEIVLEIEKFCEKNGS